MLTIYLSSNALHITFARKDEAAGNNGLPSGANGLQARQEAQDFRRCKSDAALRMDLNVFSKTVSLLKAESPRRLPALALSGGPSPVFLQAVGQAASFKKAFRRQGIGYCRCYQYCPLSPLQN